MHHKFVIRDGRTVWTGSLNWTDDAWSRQENVVVIVDSPAIAKAFTLDFEQLWSTDDVMSSGFVDPRDEDGIRAWFTPGHGEDLSARIAKLIRRARRRVRICSPVITTGPVLGTLAQVIADKSVDIAGCVDATEIREVVHQWRANENVSWKLPLLQAVLAGPFTGKNSTPFGAGTVHDYMHAKVTVCDDTTFVGSFNLSRSGEKNAENVLEIEDAGLADRLAAFVDEVRAKYRPGDPAAKLIPLARRYQRCQWITSCRGRRRSFIRDVPCSARGSGAGLPISASPIGTTSSGRPSSSSKMRFCSGWPMNALARPSSIAAASTSIIRAPASTYQYGTGQVTSTPPVACSLSASV